MLRVDLQICRAHGWTWGYWVDDLDDLERDLWRALAAYEADLCPGCGQPRTESLWQSGQPRARWEAGFTECGACHELGRQQEAQRVKDARTLDNLTGTHPKPHLVQRPVTGHRLWLVHQAPPPAAAE